MNKINLIILIYLLKPTLILMLNNVYRSLKSNEYFLDTCCSLNKNDKIYLSCGQNEKIHLNLIEIYYNSDEYCSSELYCCKYKTKCSRRITKYSSLHCDDKNSCYIDKNCLKIYNKCSSIYGLYGQYITINYSCLSLNNTFIDNYEEPVPFIVKLSTTELDNKKIIKNNFLISKDLKSSPIFLISIIFVFLLIMLISYWSADKIGKKLCRKKKSSIETKIIYQHKSDDKTKVQSNSSLPITRIYPYHFNYYYQNNPNLNNYPKKYIHVEQHPITQQIYSRTFYPYFNYYQN